MNSVFEDEEDFDDGDGDGGGEDSNEDNEEHRRQEVKIAERESQQVVCSKIVVFVFLILAAFISAIMAFFYSRQHEMAQFQSDFDAYQLVIGTQVLGHMINDYDIGESFSASMTSFAKHTGLTFPNVSLPHFEARAFKIRHLSKVDVISFQPLIRTTDQDKWIEYSVKNQGWIREGLDFLDIDQGLNYRIPTFVHDSAGQPKTKRYEPKTSAAVLQYLSDFYAPIWQTSQPPDASLVNLDMLSSTVFLPAAAQVLLHNRPHLSGVLRPEFDKLFSANTQVSNVSVQSPKSYLLFPVHDNFRDMNIAGFLMMVVPWTSLFVNILPHGVHGIMGVFRSSCGISYSFDLRGGYTSVFLGKGDRHDSKYDHMASPIYTLTDFDATSPSNFTMQNNIKIEDSCAITYQVYPTSELEAQYTTTKPLIYALVIGGVFLFTGLVFSGYDLAVRLQQQKMIERAQRTQMIVSRLFPKEIQERLIKEALHEQAAAKESQVVGLRDIDKLGTDDEGVDWSITLNPGQSKPIADLFPSASVMFAEIVGFTAWSSTREPAHVFELLETIYRSFDKLAARLRVFKVETVGSSYVATVGLPDPRKDHAIVISQFSKACLIQFNILVKQLVVELGPDTEDLRLRIGIHSGPITAGVLRGDRARFQLFGDTVNTASRMGSTGKPNMIQVSQETADQLIAGGKQGWLNKRAEAVTAKGKGRMQTYWLHTKESAQVTTVNEDIAQEGGEIAFEIAGAGGLSESNAAIIQQGGTLQADNPESDQFDKLDRLVEWNCEVLVKLICQVVARRMSIKTVHDSNDRLKALENEVGKNKLTFNEVTDMVKLPKDYIAGTDEEIDPASVVVDKTVLEQLRLFVSSIAAMYRDNPFHNFEHASHVTMSVTKLLSRIFAPDGLETSEALKDHTYGITSDPLTRLAVVLSALIHDVDHPGVPNAQLVREGSSLALTYNNKSIAEQNSVDLAWNLLMEDRFIDLRRTIYATESEFHHFRQMVVNTVLATDIMDKDLGALRKERWRKAFSDMEVTTESVNRKASIVIEHLIAASDVAHTMQHWHVYLKWNMRFFVECYKAYCDGRSAGNNPAESWYNGEIGFFDFYIIPLARKLKDCGVFGVSSDEYLQFAIANRKEWEAKGEKLVESMVESSRNAVRTGGKTPQFDPHAEGPSPYTTNLCYLPMLGK